MTEPPIAREVYDTLATAFAARDPQEHAELMRRPGFIGFRARRGVGPAMSPAG
jgi:hypothetical protein